jgi:glycosyltransferase involved in cell wall biosynthesis
MRPFHQPKPVIPELALAHDYLIQMGGAERVVASMLRRHEEAPVYTSAVRREGLLPEFERAELRTSWMQQLPGISTNFKQYYALYPHAFHSFGVVPARAAWVSASAFAKCIRFGPRTATVLYCHSPTRFLWDTETYLSTEIASPLGRQLVRATLPALRRFDRMAAARFDAVVANSQTVRRRIRVNYGIDAEVIHPPVDLSRFALATEPAGDYYLVLSRLVGYKAIDRAVHAFTALNKRLVVVGEGPDGARLRRMAGPTVEFLGKISDAEVNRWVAGCRALVFPGEEDFGIAPVEVQAAGRPVVAFAKGGALETVVEGESGCFFDQPDAESLAEAVRRCEIISWNPERIRRNAERFSEDEFHRQTTRVIAEVVARKAEVTLGHLPLPALRAAAVGTYRPRDLA